MTARGVLLVNLDGLAVMDAATGEDAGTSVLEGRTFQINVLDGKVLRLCPVVIEGEPARCPVSVAGERCGCRLGHDGPHRWQGGD